MISIIMKATTGKVLQTFTQLGGSDEVWYNPGDNKYYLAMSSWTSSGKNGYGQSHLKSWHHRCWIKGQWPERTGMDPEHFNDQDLPFGGGGLRFCL